MSEELRLDEVARTAGVASTTVRLYQQKGLLHGPRVVGRTGYYDESHLARLRLIARLQREGFSLAGISTLLSAWEHGRDLDDLVGAERELDALLGEREALTLEPLDLLARFPVGAIDAEAMQRAGQLGLVEAAPDGKIRVLDARFLETGASLVHLGVPVRVVLDEWEHLTELTDQVATRFITLFEDHLLGDDPTGEPLQLADVLGQLRHTAHEVVLAALDASIARVGARHLGERARPD